MTRERITFNNSIIKNNYFVEVAKRVITCSSTHVFTIFLYFFKLSTSLRIITVHLQVEAKYVCIIAQSNFYPIRNCVASCSQSGVLL